MRYRRPNFTLLASAALLAWLLLPVNAMAMRCGSMLVNKGDSQAKVLEYCDAPVKKSERLSLRTGFYAGTRLNNGDSSTLDIGNKRFLPYGRNEVLVEEWIFNLGPNKLMRVVTFENGIVVDVDTLGYGYND